MFLTTGNPSWLTLDYYRQMPGQIKSTICLTIIICIAAIIIGYKVKKINPLDKTPKWVVPFIALVDLINNFIKENIGRRWRLYASYIFALTIFLFVSNISGLFGLLPPTTYILVNATNAIISFFIIQITGIRSQGILGYLKEYIKPVFFLLPINIVGEFALPISMTLRITGNIIAGTAIGSMLVGIFSWFAIPMLPIVNIMLDMFGAVIQTTVFVMLTVIFSSMKVEEEEKKFFNEA